MLIEGGKSQDADAAIKLLKPLVDKKPNEANPHYRLGQAYKLKGQIQNVETEWRAAVKNDPAFVAARLALAELELQTRRYADVLAECDQLLTRQPTNRNARLLRALALAGSSREEEARQILNELLTEDPNSLITKLALARLDLLKKDYPAAEKKFAEVYKPGQADLRPLDGLLTSYLGQKEPAKALALLEKELQAAPDSFELLSRHAEVDVQSGNYAQALTEYQRLLAKDPNSARLNVRVGEVALMARNKDIAVSSFNKAAQIDPKDPRPLVMLASLQLAEGDKKSALSTYQRVLTLRPEDPYMMNNVAFLMAEIGSDTKQALEIARQGLTKQPNDPHLTDTVGYIYMKQNLNDSALQAFRAAVQKDPNNATYRLHLANALLSKGDRYEAKTQLEAALLRNPGREDEAEIRSLLSKLAP